MATNIVSPRNKSRVFNKLLGAIGKSTTLGEVGAKNLGHIRKRIWWAPDTPSVDKADNETNPYDLIQVGDLVYDSGNDLAYICTTEGSTAGGTTAAFTLVSVD